MDLAEAGDSFGAGIAAGDFNGDGFSDLSVGVNLEDVGVIADAGAANVIYGSPAGLAPTGNQFLNQDSPGIMDVAESADGFGFPPAAGDFNGDSFVDLAVGVITEDLGPFTDPGALNVIYGSATGLSAAGNQLWQQNSPGVIDGVEDFDNFGRPRVGDFNGDGFMDVGVGVIGEDVGAIVDAGAANVLYGSGTGLSAVGNQFVSQDSPGILDLAETGDSFGADRSAADFNGDGFADLALGAYLEDVGAVADAGAVNLLFGSAGGLSGAGNQFWNQDAPGVLDIAETGDLFGFSGGTGEVLTGT
jgi:hypothetical protein